MAVPVTAENLADQIAALAAADKSGLVSALGGMTTEDMTARLDLAADDMDGFWVLIAGVLVFWMQAGFGMLEAGSVRAKNVSNILFKNLLDICMGSIGFWGVGYGLAYGVAEGEEGNPFIGTGNFFLSQIGDHNASQYINFYWQLVFAATSATVISGAVAERCNIKAYFVYSFVVSTVIYPVIAHWVWSAQGWLSAFRPDRFPCGDDTCNGMIDFAGSGVVHLVGGTASFVAAWCVGPRHGKFVMDSAGNFTVNEIGGHSNVLVALGAFILWMAWYGFNCGSTLAMSNELSHLAGKVAINTTLSAAMGGLTVCLLTKHSSHWDVAATCNGILAGLVGVTAGCATVEPWGSLCIGVLAGFAYMTAVYVMEYKLRIDDPLCAVAIHATCGAWGCLAVGIFSSTDGIAFAYGFTNDAYKTGLQFGVQIVGVLAIIAWTAGTSCIMFFLMARVMDLRVDLEREKTGLDMAEHGGEGYKMKEETLEMITAFRSGAKTEQYEVPRASEAVPQPAEPAGEIAAPGSPAAAAPGETPADDGLVTKSLIFKSRFPVIVSCTFSACRVKALVLSQGDGSITIDRGQVVAASLLIEEKRSHMEILLCRY
eukprot:g60145.t1